MDVWSPEVSKAGLKNASRLELVRNNLDKARGGSDAETKRLARSVRADDPARALDFLQAIALDIAPPSPAMLQRLGPCERKVPAVGFSAPR